MGDRLDRRTFIKVTGLAAASTVLGGRLPARAAGSTRLVKVQGPGVPRDVAGALKKALAPLGGMQAFVTKGAKVVLKPNMGFATEARIRATTSPELVAAVAREVLACEPSKVLILDHPMRNPEACLRLNGIQAACKDLDVTVVLPTHERFFIDVPVPKGQQIQKVKVLRDVIECDVHIPLPVAKSHMAAGFSGGIKGHMGTILDRESFHSRFDLNQAIADLASVLRCPLSILDGLTVMTEGGPAGPGPLEATNALIAGTDMVAVDGAGVLLAPLYRRRIKPSNIRHLRKANKMGIGQLELPADQVVQLTM